MSSGYVGLRPANQPKKASRTRQEKTLTVVQSNTRHPINRASLRRFPPQPPALEKEADSSPSPSPNANACPNSCPQTKNGSRARRQRALGGDDAGPGRSPIASKVSTFVCCRHRDRDRPDLFAVLAAFASYPIGVFAVTMKGYFAESIRCRRLRGGRISKRLRRKLLA